MLGEGNIDQEVIPRAFHKAPPYNNLLIPSSNYRCQQCRVPLCNFTRIVARDAQEQSSGFSNFCIACFAGASSSPIQQPQSKYYEYYAMPSPALQKNTGSNWTSLEICALFQTVQKFGVDSWRNVHKEFTQKTGTKRLEIELAEKYFQTYRNMSQDFKYGKKDNENHFPKEKSINFQLNLNQFQPQDQVYAFQFYQLLKSTNILQLSSITTDNFWDYYVKIILQDKQTSSQIKYHESTQQISASLSTKIELASKWVEMSHKQQRQTYKILKILCQGYINMRKREDRSQRQLNTSISQKFEDQLINHPELSKLKMMSNMAEFIEKVQNLKMRREELKNRVRSESYQLRKVEKEARKSRQKEARMLRRSQRQRRQQGQSMEQSPQGIQPRRLTRLERQLRQLK